MKSIYKNNVRRLSIRAYHFSASRSSQDKVPLVLGDEPAVQVYRHVQQETEHKFVPLEQATGHIPVNRQRDLTMENVQPFFEDVVLLTLLYHLVEDLRRQGNVHT